MGANHAGERKRKRLKTCKKNELTRARKALAAAIPVSGSTASK